MAVRRKSAVRGASAKKSARKASKPAKSRKSSGEFVSEAEEILERLKEDLADLADQRQAGSDVDPDLVNRIFRSAHSLKGLAGMFGVDAISELAHHLEDILDGLRLGRISIESPAIELLDDAVALVGVLLTEVDESESEAAHLVDVRELIARIDSAVEAPGATPDEFEALALDPSLLRALTEYEEHRLRENIRRGRDLALVDSTFEIIAFEDGLSELSAAIREVGEVISTLPSPGDVPESQIRFSLLVATDMRADQLALRLELSGARVHEALRGAASPSVQEPDPPSDAKVPESSDDGAATTSEKRSGAVHTSASEDQAPEIRSLRSISNTVRVDIRKLDELMNLVGELVIQRNAVACIADRLSIAPETARIGVELTKAHKLLDRRLKELQAGVLDVRMVPLRQIFEKLSRVVRRLRRDHEKDVSLDFKGADTELDKLIAEQLVDPLMHVVRNAFDHAIESGDERLARGKEPRGAILVQAFHRGNHVVIEVVDDGRGIDPEHVRTIAESRGLVSSDDELSEKETLDLIFTPGFSTTEKVSDTSGRGVGMDVVRSNLEGLGGVVDVSSVIGRGTTITMTLPITLAIIQALIVSVGEERFAIPLISVLETLLCESSEIQRSEGREILNLRGEALELRRLSREFELEASTGEGKYYVVVLGMGDQRVGLLVDGLHGQRDAVIKPIKGPIHEIPGIAGATELGDQKVILVVDVSYLVADASRRRDAA